MHEPLMKQATSERRADLQLALVLVAEQDRDALRTV